MDNSHVIIIASYHQLTVVLLVSEQTKGPAPGPLVAKSNLISFMKSENSISTWFFLTKPRSNENSLYRAGWQWNRLAKPEVCEDEALVGASNVIQKWRGQQVSSRVQSFTSSSSLQ